MAKSTSKKKSSTYAKRVPAKTAPEKSSACPWIGLIVFLILGVISVFGYFSGEGVFINFFSGILKGIIGWGYYLLPVSFLYCAFLFLIRRGRPVCGTVIASLLLPVLLGAIYEAFTVKGLTLSLKIIPTLWRNGKILSSGGALSGYIGLLFSYLLTKACAIIIFIVAFLVLLAISLRITPATIRGWIDNRKIREKPAKEARVPRETVSYVPSDIDTEPAEDFVRTVKHPDAAIDIPLDDPRGKVIDRSKEKSLFNKQAAVQNPSDFYDKKSATQQNTPVAETSVPIEEIPQPKPAPTPISVVAEPVPASASKTRSKKAADKINFEPEIVFENESSYQFPPIELLEPPVASGNFGSEESAINKDRLEMTLRSFGVNSTISNITRGPSVTRYEMELEPGVKLNKITSLADDLALSLGASSVRIAAIPNKISTVGMEVPNKMISKVYLREIIASDTFQKSTSKITFAIGKDISGNEIIGNIAKLPHLLVAGTTGSGKSVCLNSLILSILYKASPDDVKLIMIDPKMVEFRIYNGIPHLLVPVVTEAKKASGALQWAVVEMMKRYRLFSESGARDLASYNQLAEKDETLQKLPQIVVVIDELADLMLVAAKEVEESICRVAQMGRAAGVHLVIATQSPRADVITGLMKANIPSRIAFKVSSSLESRIILDAGGNADKLVGNGDMLYAPIGSSKPARIQGTWVSDEEREKIVEFVKKDSQPNYSDEVMNEIEKAAAEKGSSGSNEPGPADNANDYDDLLPQAVDCVLELGQASVSLLQRRLKLGYSRAARIVDQMEEIGVVGPFEGSKPRQLLITKAQWQEMQFVQGTAPLEQPPEDDGQQTMFSADDLFDDE